MRPSSVSDLPVGLPPEAGHRRGDAAYGRAVFGLAAGGMANFVLLYYVQPLLPSLAEHYRVSAAASAQALSISTLAMAVALLGVGPLSDAVGRVNVMRVSLLASGILGLASAFATSWTVLLATRALMGVALAGLPAIALAYLREEVHPSAHVRANAAYIAGTATGGALGRLLPGVLSLWWGWTGTTVTIACITLVSAGLMIATVPDSRFFTPAPSGVKDLAHGLMRTVSDPTVAALCLVGIAGMGAFVGLYNSIGFRLEAAPYHLGQASALVYLAYPVGIAAPAAARTLAGRVHRGTAALALTGLLVVGTLVTASHPIALIMIGLGILTFAFLGLHSLATGWVVDRARRAGIGAAQASSSYLLLYYTGSAVVGALATHEWQVHGWTAVTILSVAMATLAAAGLVIAARHDRPSAPAPSAYAFSANRAPAREDAGRCP